MTTSSATVFFNRDGRIRRDLGPQLRDLLCLQGDRHCLMNPVALEGRPLRPQRLDDGQRRCLHTFHHLLNGSLADAPVNASADEMLPEVIRLDAHAVCDLTFEVDLDQPAALRIRNQAANIEQFPHVHRHRHDLLAVATRQRFETGKKIDNN